MTAKINYKRMLETFVKLTKVEATSFNELNMQLTAEKELKALGCRVCTDNAGKKFKTTAKGNVIGFFPGTIKSAPFLLFSHLDTVTPCKNIKAVVKGNKVTSDGTTILGADDRAGIAMILEILRTLKESGEAYPPVEVVFTLCEEDGMYGSKNLDVSKIKGREGMILDDDNNTDIIVNAPEAKFVEVEIKGVAAHAGVEPEKGISALEVAACAIAQMKLGRVEPLTVANIGIINGGDATNVVMPHLMLKGEARSRRAGGLAKQVAHMEDCFKKAQKKYTKTVDGKVIKPEIIFKASEKYPLLDIPAKCALIKHIQAVAKKHGVDAKTVSSGGGYDANTLYGKGLLTPIMGIGYRAAHTTSEWLDLKMYNQTADIVLDVILGYKK